MLRNDAISCKRNHRFFLSSVLNVYKWSSFNEIQTNVEFQTFYLLQWQTAIQEGRGVNWVNILEPFRCQRGRPAPLQVYCMTQSMLCSAIQIFHVMAQTGKFLCTFSVHDNPVKMVTHRFPECSRSGSLLFFCLCWQRIENGVPAHVCDPATPHYPGDAVHCHHGEGSAHIWETNWWFIP